MNWISLIYFTVTLLMMYFINWIGGIESVIIFGFADLISRNYYKDTESEL